MLGNFSYSNPTKLCFGENALDNLGTELEKYGKNILLVYGGGSIKKNGIYDDVVDILKKCGKQSLRMPELCPILRRETLRGSRACEKRKSRFYPCGRWRQPFVIIQRRFRFPFIVRKIRGINIIFVWRTWSVKLFRSAVSLLW